MKIATYNINNIKKRLSNLLRWLETSAPDVVCLQELKCEDASFPAEALRDAGYEAVWKGQKSWNGVAILARGAKPILTRDRLPGDPEDVQSRYIEAAVNGVLIASIYLPNGNPQPGPKFQYKLAWFKRLHQYAAELLEMDIPVILAGDFNVVPTDFDIYNTRSWMDNALLQPESREAFAKLSAQGWVDVVRTLYPDEPMYSFWHYMRNAWDRDAGLRLDMLMASPAAYERVTDAGVNRDARSLANASDHAPTWAEFED
ncbi:Exodeoxyribonuclease III [Phyllobacterium sp. YR620]|uniref:exodeoxyribonuclease III n=1 Tax=Phyllobacterium sp. YR620 TaxID=1881066 RepID=UPI000891A8C3|nr:exodeoxyribonuclease III [Phyllobacterium sp. YR620]SDP71397.1 Exodeoxyribonuclease III [Phyllobacterium sp. YR620]